MARTNEMKLHIIVALVNEKNRTLHAFYDTHIRLWTAYLVDDDDNQDGPAAYATSRAAAIDNAIDAYMGAR